MSEAKICRFRFTQADVSAEGYRVLARKYRPANFDDPLVDAAMVRTLSNAFESGRIPQAWILTGARRRKTTTRAHPARALNWRIAGRVGEGADHQMPVMGVHCQSHRKPAPGRAEMDAASYNSVEDVRQINDAIRYAPMSAR